MPEVILSDPMPPLFDEISGGRFSVLPIDAADETQLATAIGIVAYSHPTIDGHLMDRCPAVKVVSNHGVGVDHIDVVAAESRNIPVGNTPGCLDASTADMTMALILSVARNVVRGDRYARSSGFTFYDPAILVGQEVTGTTLGIIGMGRIGQEVARRALAFDMQVKYFNRNRRRDVESSLGVEFAPMNDLLQMSDFVSLNCPLTPATTGSARTARFRFAFSAWKPPRRRRVSMSWSKTAARCWFCISPTFALATN